MPDAINRCSSSETAACCCVDVGTVIDNTDCTAVYQGTFADRQQAENMLSALTAKAREVESDPCDIDSTFSDVTGGVELRSRFTFSCQAETLIFQLSLR